VADAVVTAGVSKRFGKTRAVDAVSLSVPRGQVLGLVGPNGAGKTTLLRCICGLLRMDEGQVSLDGHDIQLEAVAARHALAYIPEIPHPFSFLTPEEHLRFIARVYEVADGWEQRADQLLRDLDLAEKRKEMPMLMSKGQKQKIHLAMAMLRDSAILVLDEPLIGLDPKAQHLLKRWVRGRVSAGAGGIISSHSLALIEELCTRVAIMDHGRILAQGTFEDLRRMADAERGTSFEEVFLRITEGEAHGTP
jgi:ABC-2 type transport system ATP-binding protein